MILQDSSSSNLWCKELCKILKSTPKKHIVTAPSFGGRFSQNHRITKIGRDLWRASIWMVLMEPHLDTFLCNLLVENLASAGGLDVSREGDSTISLDSLFQCSASLLFSWQSKAWSAPHQAAGLTEQASVLFCSPPSPFSLLSFCLVQTVALGP